MSQDDHSRSFSLARRQSTDLLRTPSQALGHMGHHTEDVLKRTEPF